MEERDRERDEKYRGSRRKNKHRSKSRDSRSRSRDKSRDRSRSREKRRNDRDKDKNRSKRSRTRSKSSSKRKIPVVVSRPERSSNFSNFSQSGPGLTEVNTTALATTSTASLSALQAQQAKVDRKLYIGNLPTGITPPTLVKLLNAALTTMKANTQPGDPVLSAWISTDGHYAFVEFRSAEEANNGFLLNNVMILDQPLKVGRPKTYTGSLQMAEDGGLSNTVGAALMAGTMNAPVIGKKIQFPTKILCFNGFTRGINIEDEEEYNNVIEDLREECSKFGRVISIVIPRKDVEDNPSPGMGNAYVEFLSVEEAREVRKQLSGRKYNFRTLSITYISEDKFEKRDFDNPEINPVQKPNTTTNPMIEIVNLHL